MLTHIRTWFSIYKDESSFTQECRLCMVVLVVVLKRRVSALSSGNMSSSTMSTMSRLMSSPHCSNYHYNSSCRLITGTLEDPIKVSHRDRLQWKLHCLCGLNIERYWIQYWLVAASDGTLLSDWCRFFFLRFRVLSSLLKDQADANLLGCLWLVWQGARWLPATDRFAVECNKAKQSCPVMSKIIISIGRRFDKAARFQAKARYLMQRRHLRHRINWWMKIPHDKAIQPF